MTNKIEAIFRDIKVNEISFQYDEKEHPDDRPPKPIDCITLEDLREILTRHLAPEAEEWGEWIEHDGQSIPHIKRKIEIQHRNRNIGLREGSGRIGWLWSKKTDYLSELDIIRYRVKKH